MRYSSNMKAAALALCVMLLMPALLGAEPLKIGVFDIQRIMNEATAVNTYRQRYQNTLDLKRKPFDQTEEELKQLREQIDKGKLKPEERMAKEEEFAQKVLAARHQKEDLEAEVVKMDRWMKAQVFKDISEILEELNKKEDYSIIFERGTVAYYKNAVDITTKIIELYNKKK
ncbi:MAG: OmpH family outer membrane protein [Nitrospirae bacterium]|nr:OmpH family outer membrane protein [Nitrospirota bacterium]